jgi:predicted Zn-dependent peptidase
VEIERLEAAYDVEVERLAADVTDEEIARAKALITSQWLHHLASVDGRADTFNEYATLLGDPGLVNEALPTILRVSADEVKAVVAEVMRPDNRVVLTFLPSASDEQEAA